MSTCSAGTTIIADNGGLSDAQANFVRINGDLTISGTITSFPNYAALEVVTGNLTISGLTVLTELADIFPLLEEVQGNLIIQNNANVATITGFDVLATVGGNFTLSGNTALTSCCPFLSIASGDLTPSGTTSISGNGTGCEDATAITDACAPSEPEPIINENVVLESPEDVANALAMLPIITRINGNLTIGGALTTFPNFPNLTFVDGNITITGLTDASLTGLAGIFSLLEEVTGNLIIQNNSELLTITGFDVLREVGGNVEIGSATLGQGNGKLTAAPALDALATISGNLLIANNGSLTTTPVFSVLKTLTGNFTLTGNTGLSSCCTFFPLVSGSLPPGGSTTISGNGTGCEGEREIRAACRPPELIIDDAVTITNPATVPGNVTIITRITGNLSISGTIATFPNFEALTVVEGDLTIDDITTTLIALTDIFPVLDSVRGALIIQNQSVVQTITGFAELDSVGDGGLTIQANTSLRTLPPFDALEGIKGSITIQDNVALTTLSGFAALKTITGDLNIDPGFDQRLSPMALGIVP